MFNFQYPYIWLCCGFAALGACLYGYDGVYFNGVSTLGSSPFVFFRLLPSSLLLFRLLSS
jgi:hypothetical protein